MLFLTISISFLRSNIAQPTKGLLSQNMHTITFIHFLVRDKIHLLLFPGKLCEMVFVLKIFENKYKSLLYLLFFQCRNTPYKLTTNMNPQAEGYD